MAYTTFPRLFYFELRYQGNPGVPFSDGLGFSLGDGKLVRHAQYRTNGTVVAYEISWDSSLPTLTPFTVSGIKGCTVTSGQVNPTSPYDYSYSDNIPTYYLDVTPASAYTCHVYSGSSTANSISGATIEIRYDGNGRTYSGIGAGDYVISATTNASGNASLRWFSGYPVVVAWKRTVFSSGYTTGATTGSTTNIMIRRDSVAPVTTYSYRGYIKNAKNGTAIANATVLTINGYSGVADSSGYFNLNAGPRNPGNKWGDITGVDGYVPFHGILSSTTSSDVTIPTYYLYPDDSLPAYDISDTKILTIYDIARLMYDQWNDVSKEILGRTLNVDNVMNALYTLTKAHCLKDTGTLYDFTGKPSGYCPTAFVWDESSTEWGGYAGLINSISKELLNYQWTDNSDRLAGCNFPPFEFDYPYKRCVINGMSNFYKMYTHSMSSITASFYFKDYYGGGIYSSKVSLINWGESSGLLTLGYGEGTSTGVSYTVSYPPNNRILANFPEQIPLLWIFTVDESTSLGGGAYPRVLDAKDVLEVGNDKFTVRTYTTRRTGNKVSVQISGVFNMINFQNDFIFKIPVDANRISWTFNLPTVGVSGNGVVDSGDTGTIELVSSTGTSFTRYATSAKQVSESGVFPARTLTTSGYYRPTLSNGLYLKFIGTKDTPATYKYLKAIVGSKDFWFDVSYPSTGYNIFANITSILDTDDYITYDITARTAIVSLGTAVMSWHTTKS